MDTRRQFFQDLVGGGASVAVRPGARNRRTRHQDTRLYHGPFLVPERVAAVLTAHPGIKRTTHRHLAMRYVDEGVVYLLRCQVPASRAVLGEIVRTVAGAIRVHGWSAASSAREEPLEIVRRKSAPLGGGQEA